MCAQLLVPGSQLHGAEALVGLSRATEEDVAGSFEAVFLAKG